MSSGRTTPSSGIRPPSGLGLFSHSHASSPSVYSGSPAQHVSSSSSAHSNTTTTATSVQVALRIRPPPPHDATSTIPPRFQRSVVHPSNGSTTQLTVDAAPPGAKGPPRQNFSFDRVVGPEDGQAQVYETVEPLVGRFMEGYNVTVLAYGQTSSGKSYTMGTDTGSSSSSSASSSPPLSDRIADGQGERAGIIPRAVKQIFDEIGRRSRSESGRWKCETKTSYVEIYNEELIDLLAGDVSPDERTPVAIREDKAGHIIWSGLKEMKVKNGNEVMRNLEAGSSIRQTGSTAMNDQSSRSHAIFSLTLTQRKYVGQGSPISQPRSTDSSPSIPQNNGAFSTPSRSSIRYSGIPGRVSSPTPTSTAATGSPRPNTPGEMGRPGSRLIPRPSSSLGRAPSPAAGHLKEREEEERLAMTDNNGSNTTSNEIEWTTVISKFHFVDLAGSERLKRTSAVGDRAKEGISINGGLLALGNVISALGDPVKARHTTHIPYRDSKLTRLLQDSLGGNAHTLMIACISPVECNLSETLNTLKYANRARNIKNRAELNEIEAGWEDVEHLQQLVTRLRGELTSLRTIGGGPNGSMPAIHEDDGQSSLKSRTANSANLLHLQEQYSDLSTRYAKLTAELAKAQAAASSPSSMSPESFAQAVEPVVEEYEKSISALESQLSLTKAALSHSEEVMRETEEKINFDTQVNENNVKILNDLKVRLGKVMEREAVTEAYVRDLENRLKSSTEQDEASATLISELRKEIAKYREVEGNTERYVKDLEARLGKSEETQHMQKAQIEVLERDIQRRERAYEDLEARLSLLDTTDQHKALLLELDERDKRILDIQNELEAARLQLSALEADTRRLQADAEQDAKQKDSLHRRIQSLEKQPKISVLASSSGPISAGDTSSAQHLDISNSLTPPQPPLDEGDNTSGDSGNLVSKLAELEKRHEVSLKDLDALSNKYKESLKQIEELQSQSTQSLRYRKKSSAEEPGSSPENQLETLDDVPEEGLGLSDTGRRSSLSPINASYNTPTRASRGSTRRSMPLSPRGSFLGRSPVATHSASHLRSASASLSQDLSLAQYLNGALPSSAPTSGLPPQQPGFGSLPSPHHHQQQMILPNGASSPRPTSPLLNRRESLLQGAGEIFFSQVPERSNESLQQEVKKLQETLNEREEEIRALETSMSELKQQANAESSGQAAKTLSINTPKIVADDGLKTPVGAAPPNVLSLSPNTVEAFNAIKKSMDQSNGEAQVTDSSDAQLARLDDPMLSMAKKEVAHQEKVEELEEQLSSLRKQHEELRTLSKDQVLNTSTEITALREQLSSSGAETKELEDKLAKMDYDIKAKGNEVGAMLDEKDDSHQRALQRLQEAHAEALKEKDEIHEQSQRQLQEEHATLLQRMLEAKEGLFMRKAEEYDAALQRVKREAQDADKQRELAHQESLRAIQDEATENLLRKETEHKEALERLQLQLSASRDSDQAQLVTDLNTQHEAALKLRDGRHEETVQRLKASHEEALSARQEEHLRTLASIQEEHEATLTRVFEDHSQTLQEIRAERDSALKKSQAEHEAELDRLIKQHKEDLDKVLKDLKERLALLQSEHDKEKAAVEAHHEAALRLSASKAEEALSDMRSSFEEENAALKASHDANIAEMKSKHAEEVAAEKDLSETTLVALQEQHQSTMSTLKESHAAAMTHLVERHEATLLERTTDREAGEAQALIQLKEEHAQTMQELADMHKTEMATLVEGHEAALIRLSSKLEQQAQEQSVQHTNALDSLKSQHDQQISELAKQADDGRTSNEALSRELATVKQSLSDQEAQVSRYEQTIEDLQDRASDARQLQSEVERLSRSADLASKTEATLNRELQEALDALGTLEKALIESQDERERLMHEMSDLQKQNNKASDSLAAQLASSNEEKESLKAEVSRLTAVLSARRPTSPGAQGLGINGFASRDSKDQETLLSIQTGHEGHALAGADSSLPTSSGPYTTVRHSSVVSLVNGSHPSSRPPPTPPPSMPPPPLPTEAFNNNNNYNNFNNSVNSHHHHNNAASSSTISLSNKGRESVNSVFTRDSHMDTMTSNRTTSMADTISVDPRVHQKFEEQEAALIRLTKRLEHAETELKANIDLVTTLESALNDSERNLRKSRLQLNDFNKERESLFKQNESLRLQVIDSQREVDNARHTLEMIEEENKRKLEAQRKAQREAQGNAEARMAEIQRLNRKSKFNCF